MNIKKYLPWFMAFLCFGIASAQDGLVESLGPATFKLVFNILMVLVVVIIAVVLFFGSRAWANYRKTQKAYNITTAVFHPDGSFSTDMIGKFKDKDGLDKIKFKKSGETMPVIDPKHVVSKTVTLFRYGVGQYAVIPPYKWRELTSRLGEFKIDLINMQMKNFAFLEQRAAVSRWASMKDNMTKFAPWIAVVLILALAGVAIWLISKTGLEMYQSVVNARVQDCSQIFGIPAPAS